MKKQLTLKILPMLLLTTGCRNAELSSGEAKTMIVKTFSYPTLESKQIFCGDINQAKRLLDLGFEKDGWVVITKTKTASEMREPWITFTQKSKPYLLPTPPEEAKYKRQNIKIGEIHFVGITGILMDDDGKAATVTYTARYENMTPFAKFFKFDFGKLMEDRAYFQKYDTGWKLEKESATLLPVF